MTSGAGEVMGSFLALGERYGPLILGGAKHVRLVG